MAFWRSGEIYRYIFYGLMLLAAVAFIYLVRGLLMAFVLTGVLVYLLYPMVRAMENRGTPRVIAILLAYLGVLIIAASVLMYGIPRLVVQLHSLVYMLPTYSAQVDTFVRDIQTTYYQAELPEGMRQAIDLQITAIELRLLEFLEQTVEMLLNLVGYTFNILLAPVLAFYILKDIDVIKARAEEWFPREHFSNFWALAQQINIVLSSFIRGHLTLMVIVGGLTGIAMYLLGVEYAVMLGIIAGIAELIPYFGPFIGAVPAVTIALLHSKILALKVVISIIIIQQIEGSVIAPKVLGESVGLHPLTIILVLLAGLELYGIAGMLLAVPVAAILKILIINAYQKIILQSLK